MQADQFHLHHAFLKAGFSVNETGISITILILVTEQTGPVLLGLAWAYVTARYLHTYIHLTSNKVLVRFKVFIFSFFLLVMMWIAFAVQVIRTA